jgi:ABC-2 type transport system ATP-binding protein
MTDAAVTVEALRFAYGREPVLDGLELRVGAGEIFGVVGADGVGKSTLLRLLIGQLVPASGRIEVLGMEPWDPRLRARIAYMPQGFGQYLDLSVLENLRFFADLHGVKPLEAQALIADLLARTGLRGFEDRRAGQLSGGMMQKLALACALVSRPHAMFLDEPTTGVDPVSRRAFWQLIEGVRADGVAIVYATANMDEAERCDRVATLERGRFSRQGSPAELLAGTRAALVAVAGEQARAQRAAVAQLPQADFVFPVGRRLKVWLREGVAVDAFRAALAQRLPQLAVDPVSPTLHDVALRELALGARAPRGAPAAVP